MDTIVQQMKEDDNEKWKWRDKNLYKENVHHHVKCDQCGVTPIIGIWYKSATKENYDLCIDCEAKSGNQDIFFKIKRPEDYELFLKDLKKAV